MCSKPTQSRTRASLSEKMPALAAQWCVSKNGSLSPDDVSPGASKKVWWIGECGHEWEASVYSRAKNGTGCPYCSGNAVLQGFNDLATKAPDLASEWHPSKNGALLPQRVSANSHKRIWWKCSQGHEWIAQVKARYRDKSGCPYCTGVRPIKGLNDLASINPRLAAEWHPTKNGTLSPSDVLPFSNKKAWWLCPACHHEWMAVIGSRSTGCGCPKCGAEAAHKAKSTPKPDQSLAEVRPDLVGEWDEENNELTPFDVTYGSTRKVWWKCRFGHRWQATPNNRTAEDSGCPICSSEMKTSFPEQAVYFYLSRDCKSTVSSRQIVETAQGAYEIDAWIPEMKIGIEYDGVYWHKNSRKKDAAKNLALAGDGITLYRIREADKNELSGNTINYCFSNDVSQENLSWAIKELESLIGIMPRGDIQPHEDRFKIYEQYKQQFEANSLAAVFPEIASQWHPTKNGMLFPEMFSAHSGTKVWWQCPMGHEWQASIGNRTGVNHSGCPFCSGVKVSQGENDLQTLYPSLACEWHPTRNGGLLPTDVTAGSGRRVWWLGKCGHEWVTAISNRTKGTGCPYCSNNKLLPGYNDLQTRFLEIAQEWHPTLNGDLRPTDVLSGSNKVVWWLGKCGHEWRMDVKSRTTARCDCPYCTNKRVLKGYNDLSTTNPSLAREWNIERNCNLTPEDVVAGSTKAVWWKCSHCGYEWVAQIGKRSRSPICPKCRKKPE